MVRRYHATRSQVAALGFAVLLAVGTVGFGATVGVATHDQERTTQGFKAYTPGGEIPNPGDSMTVQLYMVPAFMDEEGPIPPDVEVRIDYQGYYTTTTSRCDTQDVFALGVDRGNNDTNTQTDDDLIQSLIENGDSERDPSDDPARMTTNDEWDHRQFTWLDLAGEEDFQETMKLNENGIEDETILAVDGCVEMPAAGWHRTFGMLNGTIKQFHSDRESVTIDGEEHQAGDRFQIWESSLWYPVCDCDESRHVAMRLDPPPGPMTPGSEGGVYHPNGTLEAPYAAVDGDGTLVYENFTVPPENVTTEGIYFPDGFLDLEGPIYYAEGYVEADGTIVTPQGERIEPEDSGSRDPPTATPTATETPDGEPTETPTATPTATETPDGEPTETPESNQNQEPVERSEKNDEGRTPTPGAGTGFGPIAALLSLLSGALLLGRRR